MNYVTLIGAEDVARAGSTIQSAAIDMQRAAGNIEQALRQHIQDLERTMVSNERWVEVGLDKAKARFHCFSTSSSEVRVGSDEREVYPVAIVEFPDGTVRPVTLDWVRFI